MAKDKLTEEILAMLANTRMEAAQSYLERGRSLESRSTEELKAGWIVQLTAMADGSAEFNRQLIDDFESELGLRNVEPPADDVPELIDRLRARSKALSDAWSEEQMENANIQVERELGKIRPSTSDKN